VGIFFCYILFKRKQLIDSESIKSILKIVKMIESTLEVREMEDSLVLEDELRKCLWAKMAPFKPLWMHLLETGIVAQQLITIGCFVPLADELVKYLEIDKEKVVALVGYLVAANFL